MAGLCKSGNEHSGSLKSSSLVKRYGITGEWRKLHGSELHSLYSSQNIIRNLKSKRLRWA